MIFYKKFSPLQSIKITSKKNDRNSGRLNPLYVPQLQSEWKFHVKRAQNRAL